MSWKEEYEKYVAEHGEPRDEIGYKEIKGYNAKIRSYEEEICNAIGVDITPEALENALKSGKINQFLYIEAMENIYRSLDEESFRLKRERGRKKWTDAQTYIKLWNATHKNKIMKKQIIKKIDEARKKR